MEPIIPAWIIYACAFLQNLDCALGILMFGSFFLIFFIYPDEINRTPEKIARWDNMKKPLVILFLVCLFLKVFIPTEKQMYAMIAANLITPDNIGMTKDGIVDILEEISKAVKEAR